MALRTIKHGLFTYWEEVEGILVGGEEGTQLVERMAFAGQEVEITREKDLKRGEELGAFFTEGELRSRGESNLRNEEGESETSISDLDDEELVDWLMSTGEFDGRKKPTVKEVLDAVGEDEDLAARVLDAEETASGGNPRTGIVDGLGSD